MPFLKITVSGPYINSDQTSYVEVDEGFDPKNNEADEKAAEDMWQQAVWEYVDGGYEVVETDEE